MLKGLFTRDGKTYYTGEDGVMLTGWQKVDGVWRYFNQQDGVMAVSTVIDGYQLDEDGVWKQ
jgi:glucan-binding YG repeat protein